MSFHPPIFRCKDLVGIERSPTAFPSMSTHTLK